MTNTSTNTSLAFAATAMAAVLVVSAAFAGVTLGTVGAASASTAATGPLNVTHADSVATAVSVDGESRQPKIVFNQSRTIEAGANDSFTIENVDTGASVSVAPAEPLNVSAGDALELEVVTGGGSQATTSTIQLEHNGTQTSYNATVNGDFASTFQAPYSNLTVTFVDDGVAVDSTERAAIHPVDYDAAFQQNSTSGTVAVSFARDGLPTTSQVDYSLFDENVDVPLSYNATSDRFEGTVDVSSLNESSYPGGGFFSHPDDGFYFGANGELVVNRSSGSGASSGGGGGSAAGPVDISHSTTTFGKGDANARGRRPGVMFNQSITLDSADALVVTNVESGAQTLVEPTNPINVSTDDDVALNVVLGDGSADPTPKLQLHTPENNTYFTANVSGNVSGTFRGPYSNLTIAYVDNGTTVDTTGEAIHPYNYTKDHRQNSTNGTVRISLARGGLPKSTTVGYSVYQENVSGQLTYNTTDDAFVGTIDTSPLPDGAYSVYPSFRTTDGGSYFFTINELVVNGSNATADVANVTITNQTTNGTDATVDSVYLPDGGFVSIHDDSLFDGATFDSIRGTSGYLAAGNHTGVRIELDDPLAVDQEVFAVPFRDTDGDQQYDFTTTNGQDDGPYTDTDGNIVLDSGNASVDLTGEPGNASVYLEPADQTVTVGENVTYLVRVANPGAAVGALNISVAPSTAGAEIVGAGVPNRPDLSEVDIHADGSVQLRAAGMDTGLDDPIVAAITVRGTQAGNGTLVPTVDTLADERGLEYNVTAATGSNYTVTRPSLTLDLVPSNTETRVGEQNAYTLVARNVDDGVGALNVTVTLDDDSVADIVGRDVAGTPDLTSSVHETANGTETLTIRAAGMDTPDTGDMPIGAVYLEGAQQGNATLTLEGNVVATEAGTEYVVSNTPSAPVVVPQPKVDVFVAPQENDVQPGETFTVDIVSDTNTLGVYGEQFTLAFNESLLNATGVSEGPFLSKDGASTTTYGNGIDNQNGTVSFGVSRSTGDTSEVSGTGVVATVTFRVGENVTRGSYSPLDLQDVIVSDSSSTELPARRANGTASVPLNLPPGLDATLVSTVANEGQPVKIRADANDSDGTITTVSLRDPNGTELDSESCGSACLHTLSATPNFHTWNGSGYDATTLYTVAVDDDGADVVREVQFTVYTAGDANGDGTVNILDATRLGTSWKTQRGDAEYSDAADQNNDGEVNILDATILGTNWKDEATTNSTSS